MPVATTLYNLGLVFGHKLVIEIQQEGGDVKEYHVLIEMTSRSSN